jgi:hypothetical protein
MSTAELTLAYSEDNEGDGTIEATVTAGAFAGSGSAFSYGEHIKKTFVASLRQYPLAAATPPILEGGTWSRERPPRLISCHLRVAVRPYNSRGTLLVRVDLASPSWPASGEELSTVSVAFLTDYNTIASFADDLERVLNRGAETAVIRGFPRGVPI